MEEAWRVVERMKYQQPEYLLVLTLVSISGRKGHAGSNRRLKALAVISLFLISVIYAGFGGNLIKPVNGITNYTLTEWTVPTANSGPYGMSLDTSGNCCWFLEFFGNKLAHLDPTTGTFQEWPLPTANAQPTGVTTTVFSGQMMVWGTEFNANKVFVFYPSSNTFYEFTLPTTNSGPEYISIEPSGASVRAWVTEFGTSGTRNANGEFIYNPGSPTTATLYEDTLPAGAGGGANGLYATSGAVWYAGVTGLVKWDRASNQYSVWALPTHGSAFGRFLTLDALGQVWYTQGVSTSSGSDNYVGVLRGDNTIKEWQIPTVGSDPRVISFNPLTLHPWVAEDSQNAGNGRIAELDPSGGGSTTGYITPATSASGLANTAVTSPAIPPVSPSTNVVAPTSAPNVGVPNGQFTEWSIGTSTQPHDVSVDSSGNIWLLESGANKVARLTPNAPDFTLNPSAPTISIPQGGSDTVTITGTSELSFSGAVTLSVTGSVPTGVTFSFSPNPISIPSGSSAPSTLGINVGSGAPVGTTTITVSGTGSSGTHTTSFALTITSGTDFSTALSSPTLSVGAGASATDTVTITSIGSFNSAVNLDAGSPPSGVHVSFSTNPVTPPTGGTVTSVATVSIDSGTAPGAFTITITGTSGSLSHSQTIALTITVTPDFTITSTLATMTLVQGNSETATITIASINSFNSPVALSYSWIGTAPSDVSVSLPGPVTPQSGGTATSTLTVNAGSSASTGSFTLSVTGTSGALNHNVNVGVTISAATTTTSPTGPTCLIATATYGSELAPEVQLLRNFRDRSIMKTQAGANFMVAFNAWYYSFSPYVANYISTHWVERTIMKGVLYPLIGMLYLTSNLYTATSTSPELAALLSGLLASSLIGAFYLGLPLSLIRAKVRRLRGARAQGLLLKLLTTSLTGGILTLIIGEVTSSPILLMVSSATIVLSALFLSATVTSAKVAKRLHPKI
jgi:streptogramin lyase